LKNIILFLFLTLPFIALSQNPVELGDVKWLRDYDKALQESERLDKPVFILFQEVPGCATCRNYGQKVLSHPLIVEAIEDLFVPLAIYNNKGGADKEVLQKYGEPAWNNPVVRMVDQLGENLVPRINGDYTVLGVAERMIYALQRADRSVPTYLELLRDELRARQEGTSKATFSMYCFWTGERTYGQLDGVISTRPGFMDGHEVVEVEYNPAMIELDDMIAFGQRGSCADRMYTHDAGQTATAAEVMGNSKVATSKTFRQDREPKYYLSKTHYRAVPMTDLQATRANSLLGRGKSPDTVLSPRQIQYAESIKGSSDSKLKNLIGKPIDP
jgi:hypothetical protein